MLQNQPLRKPREKTPGYRDLARRADGSQRHVLYAEDQASTRIVTEALLKRMGFAVVAVEDGELAVEKAKAARFDLILLDIEMPNMDGVQQHAKSGPMLVPASRRRSWPCRLFWPTQRNIPSGAMHSTAPCQSPPTAMSCVAHFHKSLKAGQQKIRHCPIKSPINGHNFIPVLPAEPVASW